MGTSHRAGWRPRPVRPARSERAVARVASVLTVRSLVEEAGLELATGTERADAPLRWVHITELLDPTPWLSGGELLLTTGLQLQTASKQRQFVRRLSSHHLSGLGF